MATLGAVIIFNQVLGGGGCMKAYSYRDPKGITLLVGNCDRIHGAGERLEAGLQISCAAHGVCSELGTGKREFGIHKKRGAM